MDRTWNRDYVSEGCEIRSKTSGGPSDLCKQNGQLSLNSYERILATSIASDPTCRGVLYISGLEEVQGRLRRSCRLTGSFQSISPRMMERGRTRRSSTPLTINTTLLNGLGEGADNRKEAARNICNYVKNRGAI